MNSKTSRVAEQGEKPLLVAIRVAKVGLLVGGIYFVLNFSTFLGGSFSLSESKEPLSLALLFVAGTLTGFHCAGMCGSLVVGYTVRSASQGQGSKYLTHLAYGFGKTVSYTVMGGIFGGLGSIVTFTPFLRGLAGLLAGIFLFLFGLSSLQMLPFRRHFQMRMPPALMRVLGKLLKDSGSPLVIGLLNGLMIICGPLQAMYIMAAGTGSPLEGAKMLLFFGLGTLPLMLGFGLLASALSRQFAPRLVKASGVIVIALGILMGQRGYAMLAKGEDIHAAMGHSAPVMDRSGGVRVVHTQITQAGSLPEIPVLTVGEPMEWMLMGSGLENCGGHVGFGPEGPMFNLGPDGGSFRWTPERVGRVHWTCETGFASGDFDVTPAATSASFLPMAEQIQRLIEGSASVLDRLQRQLHP